MYIANYNIKESVPQGGKRKKIKKSKNKVLFPTKVDKSK